MAGWLHGVLWVNGFSFFHCVASPFHSFVTTFWIELLYWQGGVDPEIATHECVASPFSLLYSCSAHVRPCAQGRCGRCPFGFGVMPDTSFCFFL